MSSFHFGSTEKHFAFLLLFCLVFLLVLPVNADIVTDGQFNMNYNQGETFQVQNETVLLTFTVYSGTLNGTGTLATDSEGGTLSISPSSMGSLVCTSNDSSTIIYINSLNHTGIPFGFGAAQFNITWGWITAPTLPDNPFGVGILAQLQFLFQYLWNRDFVGFITACYVTQMGQWFYLMLATIIALALYLKIKHLGVLTVAYFLTGAIFIPAIPEAWPVISICILFGLAPLLWKLFHHIT